MTDGYTIGCSFTVHDMGRGQLEDAADRLMEQLLALEGAECGTHSAAVSVDLGEHEITIEVGVDESDLNVATAVARSCIRAAIHATGGATPDWDRAPTKVRPERVSA